MDPGLLIKAIIMGIVEGLTEFLPVSSTGHLIVAGSLLDFAVRNAVTFEIAIQTGAMFAVIWEYRRRIVRTVSGIGTEASAQRFALNVAIAFLPAAIFGIALGKAIKAHLFNPVAVAIAFVVGGLIILWVEIGRRHVDRTGEHPDGRRSRVESVDEMSPLDALRIGLVQCVALVPGTSRSGATIIGGMIFGLSRRAATEFSFYLAIPTLLAAGAYSLYKERGALGAADMPLFAVGTVVSFISALLCIRWLIRYVAGHDFIAFAWYRIVFGAVVLWTAYAGLVTWKHS